MQFDGNCIECLVKRQWELARRHGDGEKANDYLREVLQIILDAPAGVAAPWLSGAFAEAYQKYWPGEDAYAQLKRIPTTWCCLFSRRCAPRWHRRKIR